MKHKYIVNEIEGDIAKLENLETKKIKTVNVKEMPSIMEGDIVYSYDGIYVIDATDKMQRKTELREELNTIKDVDLDYEDE